MANLAIRGHATRGKEVIQILEMLGGVNKFKVDAIKEDYIYYSVYIDNTIDCKKTSRAIPEQYIIYTLEEFLENFPYKVGDKVKVPYEDGRVTGNELYEYKILKIKWCSFESMIKYGLPSGDEQRIEYYSTDNLNIWNKKETMDKVNEAVFDANAQCCDIMNNLIKEETKGKVIKIDTPKGYEFTGVVNKQVVFTKIQPKYPKTYEECCEVFEDNFLNVI